MAGSLPTVTLVALEGTAASVTAGYNPKELGVDKSVPWQFAPISLGEQPILQFGGAEGRTMTVEMVIGDGIAGDLREEGGETRCAAALTGLSRLTAT